MRHLSFLLFLWFTPMLAQQDQDFSAIVTQAEKLRATRQFPEALQLIEQAKTTAEQKKDSVQIISAILQRGITLSQSKQFTKAIPDLDRAFLFFGKRHNIQEATASLYLGQAYFGLRQYKPGLFFLSSAEEKFRKGQDTLQWANTLVFLARNFVATRKFKEARACLNKAKLLAQNKTTSTPYLDIIGAETDYFEASGDYKNALRSQRYQYQLQQNLKANLAQASAGKGDKSLVAQASTAPATEAAVEAAPAVLNDTAVSDNKAATQFAFNPFLLFGALALFVLILAWMAYKTYRSRISVSHELHSFNGLKSNLLAQVSQEFGQAIRSERSNDKLLELSQQLEDLSRLEEQRYKLEIKRQDLDAFLYETLAPFKDRDSHLDTNFIWNLAKMGQQPFDASVLRKILHNLLSNALLHSDTTQPVYFSASADGGKLLLRFANSGTDLSKEAIQNLCNGLGQERENLRSSGIGLGLVKELVALYGGSLKTKLQGKTLIMTIKLPLDATHPNAGTNDVAAARASVERTEKSAEPVASVSIKDKKEIESTEVASEPTPSATVKPVMLLVDADAATRNALRNLFENVFEIFEAEDGDSAIATAREQIPNIIISEIAMPKMNGLAFSYALKNDPLTSYIPLVILTGVAEEEAQSRILSHTADAFLTKPLEAQKLREAVARLCADKQLLQAVYQTELVMRPQHLILNPVEDQFIAKLQRLLSEHNQNPAFGMAEFAQAMEMNTNQMERKIQSLWGVSLASLKAHTLQTTQQKV